jgi:hypothetical protein
LRLGSSPGGGKGDRGLEGSPLDAGAVDMAEREMFVSGVIYPQRRNAGLEMGRQWFRQENGKAIDDVETGIIIQPG